MDHDRLFKDLLDTFFLEFVELFLPDVAAYLDGSTVERLDKEFFDDPASRERLEADVVVKARFRGADTCFLIHVEHQAQADPDLPRRMFRYYARLDERHGLPIYPVVLLSYASPRKPAPVGYEVTFPDGAWVLRLNYKIIQLNTLNWHEFTRHRNPVATALMSRMAIARGEQPIVKLQCLRLLATLKLDPARMSLIARFLDAYIPLHEADQMRFKAELDRLSPAEREDVVGVADYLQMYVEDGRAVGRQEGELHVVTRLIERRFGPLDATLKAQLTALPSPRLEALVDVLFDLPDLRALNAWLVRKPRLRRAK